MNKEKTEALKRIESIRAELEQLERVVAKPVYEPQPGDVVKVCDSVRIFSHMQGSEYACLHRDYEWSHTDVMYYSECRPATPVVAPKHVEPELCKHVSTFGQLTRECISNHHWSAMSLTTKAVSGAYDVIICTAISDGLDYVYLGHWNDGPKA